MSVKYPGTELLNKLPEQFRDPVFSIVIGMLNTKPMTGLEILEILVSNLEPAIVEFRSEIIYNESINQCGENW